MKIVLSTAILAAALGLGSVGASAAPANVGGLTSAVERPVTEVRMKRKKHMMRKSRRKSVGGNTKNPARSPMQQNRGQTSGGPAGR